MQFRVTIVLPHEPHTWVTTVEADSRDAALIQAGQRSQRAGIGISFTRFSVTAEKIEK